MVGEVSDLPIFRGGAVGSLVSLSRIRSLPATSNVLRPQGILTAIQIAFPLGSLRVSHRSSNALAHLRMATVRSGKPGSERKEFENDAKQD